MGRKKNKLRENVLIEKYAAEGKAIAYINEMVTFVEGAIPGDVADILIKRKRKNHMEGRLYQLKEPSPLRKEARCQHFGICGGCKWQHLDYQKQLEFKEQQVKDSLERIGKVDVEDFQQIMGSKEIFNYRNKLDFSFSHKRWMTKEEIDSDEIVDEGALGFHVPGRWDKVLEVTECHLQPDPSNAIRNRVRELAAEHNLTYFNLNEQKGFLRGLILRNTLAGDFMLSLMTGEKNPKGVKLILDDLISNFPQLTSVYHILNLKQNDSIYDLDPELYDGEPYITEKMEDLEFRIGPKSFFQTNGAQALELYKLTREMARLTSEELVYDLYTGTGTIAQFVSKQAKKVVGIESVPEAIEDAKINAELNGITNCSFYAGDMKNILTDELIEKEGRPDVVITDPPRAGMHGDVVEQLRQMAPQRIVYVSCNPATQARDLQLLDDLYKVKIARPVDMFPHTHHVENVVMLERRG